MNNYMKTIISGLKQWVSSQKSDWKQNDSSAPNYVKNRTHYEENKEIEILPKTTCDSIDPELTLKAPFVQGAIYTVTCNNTTYECVAKYYDGYVMIGNNAIYEYDNGETTDTGEPFAIECEVDSIQAYPDFDDTITSPPTLRITSIGEVVHKLDKKYLPDGLVSYSEAQELTDSQKLQARDNIGAGDFDGDYNKLINQPKSVLYTYQPLSAVQKAQARTNIGAGTSNFSGDYYDLTNRPTIPTDVVRYGVVQDPPESQKAQARRNIGAGTSNFSGNYNDLTNKPTIIEDAIRYSTTQTLTSTQKEQARNNIGAGTSSFSGDYNDLTSKPTIEDFGIYVQAQEPTDASIGSIWIDTSVVGAIAAEEVNF